MNFIKKPWGSELIIESNDKYTFKKLTMHQGCQCSLQYHEFKHETIYHLKGKMKFLIGKSKDTLVEKIINPGESFSIEPKIIHRMIALTDIEYLEASTSELDDVVRITDDYGR